MDQHHLQQSTDGYAHLAPSRSPNGSTDQTPMVQVPNRPKPKDDDKDKDKKDKSRDHKSEKKDDKRFSTSSAESNSHPERKWHKKGSHDPHDQASEPLLTSLSKQDEPVYRGETPFQHGHDEDEKTAKEKEDQEKETAELEGLIEKKTYIGLVGPDEDIADSRFKRLRWR